jgi:hypothetical protein
VASSENAMVPNPELPQYPPGAIYQPNHVAVSQREVGAKNLPIDNPKKDHMDIPLWA